MSARDYWARVNGAYRRRMARWLGRRLFTMPEGQDIISFTFDDFPQSALNIGGSILERYGLPGTYYASFGLTEQMTPTGEIFRLGDVKSLLERGHELGCHTFDHFPAWETRPAVYERSVQ